MHGLVRAQSLAGSASLLRRRHHRDRQLGRRAGITRHRHRPAQLPVRRRRQRRRARCRHPLANRPSSMVSTQRLGCVMCWPISSGIRSTGLTISCPGTAPRSSRRLKYTLLPSAEMPTAINSTPGSRQLWLYAYETVT